MSFREMKSTSTVITLTGSAQAISATDSWVRSAVLESVAGNADLYVAARSDVSAANGHLIQAKEQFAVAGDQGQGATTLINLKDWYLIGTASDTVILTTLRFVDDHN